MNEENLLPTPANYATPDQISAVREYAKALLTGSGQQPVHHWAQGLSNMVSALVGGYDLNKAGNMENAMNQRGAFDLGQTNQSLMPGQDAPPANTRVSPDLHASASPDGTPPSAQAFMPEDKIDAIKDSEGFSPVAKWDQKQYSYGYGSRAPGAGASIDPATADTQLRSELKQAADVVDKVNPHLSPGTRSALISLTYNSGDGWTNSGLGQAVKAGDERTAQQIFAQYNKAGGEPNPALIARRAREGTWFGQGSPETGSAGPEAMPFSGEPANPMPADNALAGIARALAAPKGGGGNVAPPMTPPGAASQPVAPMSAGGGSTPIQYDPNLLPKRPQISRELFQSLYSNKFLPPNVRDFVLQSYYGQNQPYQMDYMGGAMVLDPRTGQGMWTPKPTIHDVKAGDVTAPAMLYPGLDGQLHGSGLPVSRPVTSAAPNSGAIPNLTGGGEQPGMLGAPPPTGPAPGSGPSPAPGAAPPAGAPGTMPAPVSGTASLGADGSLTSGIPNLLHYAPDDNPALSTAPPPSAAQGTKEAQLAPSGGYVQDLMNLNLDYQRRKENTQKDVEAYRKEVESAVQAGQGARMNLPQLKQAREMVDDPRFYSGPASRLVMSFKQLQATLGDDPTKAAAMETFKKLISGNIVKDLRTDLSGLGQVRLKEMELLEQATGNLDYTKEANRAVLDLAIKAHQQVANLQYMANLYDQGVRWDPKTGVGSMTGEAPTKAGLDAVLQTWVDKHPMISDEEIKNYKQILFKHAPENTQTTYTDSGAGQPAQPAQQGGPPELKGDALIKAIQDKLQQRGGQ